MKGPTLLDQITYLYQRMAVFILSDTRSTNTLRIFLRRDFFSHRDRPFPRCRFEQTHIYIYIYIFMCIYINVYISYVYIYIYIYIYIYVCVYVCTYIGPT